MKASFKLIKHLEKMKKYFINNIWEIKIKLKNPFVIFFKGDLWSWKTTFSKYIINEILWVKKDVISPTYTYYNKYIMKEILLGNTSKNNLYIYHFDLYKLEKYDEFFAIGGEDIFDNNTWIILVEWPEIIEPYYKCDMLIKLKRTWIKREREIEIIT